MGSYASEPKVDKESLDETNDRLNCGASSMQGWRITQEDAHNCILDFDTNTSFFAVYDGHGGHEVAQYCSQKLPEFIKNTEFYKNGDIENALIEGFLDFDQTITTPEVLSTLKSIANLNDEDGSSEDEENVNNLYEEAAMPIEKVIEKYAANVNSAIKNLKKQEEKAPQSPYLKAKKENGNGDGCSSSTTDTHAPKIEEAASSSLVNDENNVSCSSDVKDTKSQEAPEGHTQSTEVSSPDKPDKQEHKDDKCQNGEVNEVTSSKVTENGEVTPKGKGKALMKRITPTPVKSSPRLQQKANSSDLYKKLLRTPGSEEEDSEDEEDETFVGSPNASTDDDENVTNSHLEPESDDSSNEDEDDEEEDSYDEDIESEFTRNMKEDPGSDSGCTAVVAITKDRKLWVANAGDSRCVVCRSGKAIEMSFDHKPEDIPERARIEKAGGQVTLDGRVNNGLNLSRAIGDHAYKQNTTLGPKEQMITALPDIKTLELNPDEDEFMVLACDGIWNYMSSQEVVDFVREKLKEKKDKLSAICEELFDHCLAPNTDGDGTGCDNMTAIIVQFKSNKKRAASPDTSESVTSKKAKTDVELESEV